MNKIIPNGEARTRMVEQLAAVKTKLKHTNGGVPCDHQPCADQNDPPK